MYKKWGIADGLESLQNIFSKVIHLCCHVWGHERATLPPRMGYTRLQIKEVSVFEVISTQIWLELHDLHVKLGFFSPIVLNMKLRQSYSRYSLYIKGSQNFGGEVSTLCSYRVTDMDRQIWFIYASFTFMFFQGPSLTGHGIFSFLKLNRLNRKRTFLLLRLFSNVYEVYEFYMILTF